MQDSKKAKAVTVDAPMEPRCSKRARDADEQQSEERKRQNEKVEEKIFLTFPEKLMSIAEDEENEGSIRWNPSGRAFCICPKRFPDEILQEHFQGTKFESFTRKLNRWGFKRILDKYFSPDSVAYVHIFFQKGKPELLKKMSGGKKKEEPNTSRGTHSPYHQSQGLFYDTSAIMRNAALPETTSSSQELRRELLSQKLLQQSYMSNQSPLDALRSQSQSSLQQAEAANQMLASRRLQQFQQQQVADQILRADRLRSLQLQRHAVSLPMADQFLFRQTDQASVAEQFLMSQQLRQQQQFGNASATELDPLLGLQANEAAAIEHSLANRRLQQDSVSQQLGLPDYSRRADPLASRRAIQHERELRLCLLLQEQQGASTAMARALRVAPNPPGRGGMASSGSKLSPQRGLPDIDRTGGV